MSSGMFGRLAVAAAALVLLAGAAAQAQQMTERESTLYEAAKKEGSIVWYVSQTTTEFADLACRQFNAKYQGVTCNAVRASGQVVMQRLMQEVKASAVQADVMSTNDDGQMVILDRAKQLAEYTPENQTYMIPALLKAGNGGKWSITSVAPLGMMANSKLVKPEEAPKDTLKKTARWPLRTDVAAPEGMPGLDRAKLISTPTQEVMDQLKEVQQQFRDTFGI